MIKNTLTFSVSRRRWLLNQYSYLNLGCFWSPGILIFLVLWAFLFWVWVYEHNIRYFSPCSTIKSKFGTEGKLTSPLWSIWNAKRNDTLEIHDFQEKWESDKMGKRNGKAINNVRFILDSCGWEFYCNKFFNFKNWPIRPIFWDVGDDVAKKNK